MQQSRAQKVVERFCQHLIHTPVEAVEPRPGEYWVSRADVGDLAQIRPSVGPVIFVDEEASQVGGGPWPSATQAAIMVTIRPRNVKVKDGEFIVSNDPRMPAG